MKYLVTIIALSLLSACTPPCMTANDIMNRPDCNKIQQVIAAIP